MPDFDVQVLGLTSPLANAPVTTYTPAISTRNNGLAAAVVTGVLRIYEKEAPGELLFTQTLTPKTIAAGATADVLSSLTWTPTVPQIGTSYVFTADITATGDQVEQNNHLNPTFVTVVAGAPPPPPPVVTTHAAQHEAGGTDELHVDGLPGELADDQPAKDHAGKHEQGGADQLSVTGLTGELATAQLAKAHANERHSTAFASATEIAVEIDEHDESATAHATVTAIERTARKGAASGYAGLGANSLVPVAQLGTGASVTGKFLLGGDQAYQLRQGAVCSALLAEKVDITPAADTDIILLQIPLADRTQEMQLDFLVRGYLTNGTASAQIDITLMYSQSGLVYSGLGTIQSALVPFHAGTTALEARGSLRIKANLNWSYHTTNMVANFPGIPYTAREFLQSYDTYDHQEIPDVTYLKLVGKISAGAGNKLTVTQARILRVAMP